MVTAKGLAKAAKNVLLAPFRAGMTLWLRSMQVLLYASVIVALLSVALLGHMAWHASHPLENPRYKGLTYWQLLKWEKMVTDRQTTAWNRAHPNLNPDSWQACVFAEVGAGAAMYAMTARYYLLHWPGSVPDYLHAVDKTWEKYGVGLGYSPSASADPCVYHYIPTPEELPKLEAEYNAWKASQVKP